MGITPPSNIYLKLLGYLFATILLLYIFIPQVNGFIIIPPNGFLRYEGDYEVRAFSDESGILDAVVNEWGKLSIEYRVMKNTVDSYEIEATYIFFIRDSSRSIREITRIYVIDRFSNTVELGNIKMQIPLIVNVSNLDGGFSLFLYEGPDILVSSEDPIVIKSGVVEYGNNFYNIVGFASQVNIYIPQASLEFSGDIWLYFDEATGILLELSGFLPEFLPDGYIVNVINLKMVSTNINLLLERREGLSEFYFLIYKSFSSYDPLPKMILWLSTASIVIMLFVVYDKAKSRLKNVRSKSR